MRPAPKWLNYIIVASFILILSGCQKSLPGEERATGATDTKAGLTAKTTRVSGQVATDWIKRMLEMILYSSPQPVSTHVLPYASIALYESVRYGIPGSVSLSQSLYQMPAMPLRENNNGYDWEVAANAALAYMARALFPNASAALKASVDSLEAAYNQRATPSMQSQVFARSQAYGRAVAETVFNWSKTDGDDKTGGPYTPPVFPGAWEPTSPPSPSGFAINAHIENARPFLEEHKTWVGAPPSVAFSFTPGSPYYNMALELYNASLSLTQDQKEMAAHWIDQGTGFGYTPSGHEMNIVVNALINKQVDLSLAAKTLVLVSIAQREAVITAFKTKYAYTTMRPYTYIRRYISSTWTPYIPTPFHPEYPAAHSFITTAAMTAAAAVLGDNYSFTDDTYAFRNAPLRHYNSFTDVGREAGLSRLYGGIHYRPSIEAGYGMGAEIARHVIAIRLTE